MEAHEYHDDDPFDGLDLSGHDPVFTSILEEVAEVKETLQGMKEVDWKAVRETLEPLNDSWDATPWLGGQALITGRLRFADDGYDDMPEYNKCTMQQTRQWTRGEDERGAYFDVVEMPMLCGLFDVYPRYEDDEEGNSRRLPTRDLGLTFMHPELYDEGSDDFHGPFIIDPSDLVHIEFDRTSSLAIENDLKLYFPALFAHVVDCIGGACTDAQKIAGLKRLAVPASETAYHGYPLKERLGQYLYERLNFDNDYYRIETDGPVRAIDATDVPQENQDSTKPIKRRGFICTIIMEDDGDVGDPQWRPSLILAVPHPESRGEYYACIVPAESLVFARSQRDRRADFGKTVLLSFLSPAEVGDYFCNYTPDDMQPDAPEVIHIGGNDRTVDKHSLTLRARYANILRETENVTHDLETIKHSFMEEIARLVVDRGGAYDLRAITDTVNSIEKVITKLQRLSPGDVIQVASPAILTTLDGATASLPAGVVVQGRFLSISVGEEPSMLEMILGDDCTAPRELAVSVVVEEPIFLDPTSGAIVGEYEPLINLVLGDIVPTTSRGLVSEEW